MGSSSDCGNTSHNLIRHQCHRCKLWRFHCTWLCVGGISSFPEAVVPCTSLLSPLTPPPPSLPLASPPSRLPLSLTPLPVGRLGPAQAPPTLPPPPPPLPIADNDWPLSPPLPLLLRVWPFPEKALTWELDDCFCTTPLRPIVILGCSSDVEWPCCELWWKAIFAKLSCSGVRGPTGMCWKPAYIVFVVGVCL